MIRRYQKDDRGKIERSGSAIFFFFLRKKLIDYIISCERDSGWILEFFPMELQQEGVSCTTIAERGGGEETNSQTGAIL